MRLRGRIAVGVVLFGLRLAAVCRAQGVAAAWTGEWGSFQASAVDLSWPPGRGLSVSRCDGPRCTFSITVQVKQAHGDAVGYLDVQSETVAVAHLIYGPAGG